MNPLPRLVRQHFVLLLFCFAVGFLGCRAVVGRPSPIDKVAPTVAVSSSVAVAVAVPSLLVGATRTSSAIGGPSAVAPPPFAVPSLVAGFCEKHPDEKGCSPPPKRPPDGASPDGGTKLDVGASPDGALKMSDADMPSGYCKRHPDSRDCKPLPPPPPPRPSDGGTKFGCNHGAAQAGDTLGGFLHPLREPAVFSSLRNWVQLRPFPRVVAWRTAYRSNMIYNFQRRANINDFPVPPDWIIADPEENKRRILAMLEQGERDIAAGRGYDLDEVMADLDAS